MLAALLSGTATASAAEKEVRIEEGTTVEVTNGTDHDACLKYDKSATDTDTRKTNSPSGNKLTIFGTVNRSQGSYTVAAAYSGGGGRGPL